MDRVCQVHQKGKGPVVVMVGTNEQRNCMGSSNQRIV